jgi:hypothetical protein
MNLLKSWNLFYFTQKLHINSGALPSDELNSVIFAIISMFNVLRTLVLDVKEV